MFGPRSLCAALVFLAAACSQEPRATDRRLSALTDEPPLTETSQAVASHMAYRAWADRFKQTAESKRAGLLPEGEDRARARRQHLVSAMRLDPELALSMAVTLAERQMMPAEVAQHLETWRDARGAVHVIGGVADSAEPTAPLTETFVSFEGREQALRTTLHGRRGALSSREGVRLHGIELDGVFAMSDLPFRRVRPEDAVFFDYVPGSPCPTSQKASTATELIHDGDELKGFCQPIHAEAYGQSLLDEETAADLETAASTWTEGNKSLLFLRVDFDDRVGDPLSLASATSLMNNVNGFFTSQSFNKTSLTTTFPPTLRMPYTSGYYRDAGLYVQLLSDARIAARDAGFDPNGYNLDVLAHPGLFSGWAGRGYVGGKGTWLNGNFSQGVTAHELGHNYGVYHANFWSAGESIIGAGSQQEYGNPFDVMGSSGASHFNAFFKRSFDWIVEGQVRTVAASGTYRIYPLEVATPDGGFSTLKVARNDSQQRTYWLEFRQLITGNVSLMNGASFNFGFPSATTTCPTTPPTGCGSHLLDMTPGGNTQNSPLVIGRTFSDPGIDVHFTPIGKGGTTPESLDVVVNFGPYPTNRAPTLAVTASQTTVPSNTQVSFTATATDTDGDPLAYSWDFDDGTFSIDNLPTQQRTLTGNRQYFVRCTVSDMKGRTTTGGVLVTVGTPTTFQVSGVITSADAGLEGARITDGTRTTFSLPDGTWVLTNVPGSPPDGGGLTISAAKFDYAMTRNFAAPLPVLADVSGLSFTAVARTGYSITGRVTANGSGVQAVTVAAGARTATTNANGDFSISNVPNGRYTVTATKLGWNFGLTGTMRNPIEVLGGNAGNVNFTAQGQNLNGQLPSSLTTAPVVTDGYRTVTATRGRTQDPWFYYMSGVPNGSWNLTATSPGVTLEPQFTNPVVVTGMSRSGLNFTVAGTSPTFQITGTARTGSTPLPGVAVTDGTRSSTTDSFGRYVLTSVPAGTFTLTPTRSGYTFMPVSRMVTVTSANVANVDFDTTTVNASPTFATAPRASMTPTTASTVVLTTLGADDTGESGLVYEWFATSSPWPVTFSSNQSNAAKSTTVTFSGAGSYTFEVVVTDAGGLSVRGSVTVVVTQVPQRLEINPMSASVVTGAQAFFGAYGRDQFDRSVFVGVATWTVTGGGTIEASGRFTAGPTPGGPFTVTAMAGGFTATAMLTVVGGGAPTLVTPARATPSPVTSTTTLLTVRATDDAGEASLRYTWSSLSGPAPVTFSANNSNAAKDTTATFTQAGSYEFLVTITDSSGNVITSVVVVQVEPTPTVIAVTPATVAVTVNDTEQFIRRVEDQFGDLISPLPVVSWTVSGGGAIDADGLFTAGATPGGPFTVTASAGSVIGTAQVTVSATADTQPPQVQLTAPQNNTRVSGRVRLVATASDNVGVTRVEFFEGSTSLGQVAAMPWELEVDTGPWTNGLKSLTARATDAAGNGTTSPVIVVIIGMSGVDVAPPVVSITAPLDGATTGSSVPVSVDASDDVGVTRVDFELDGAASGSDAASPWETTLSAAAGPHSVVAIAHDASGKSTRSAAVTFTVQVGAGGGSSGVGGGSGGGGGVGGGAAGSGVGGGAAGSGVGGGDAGSGVGGGDAGGTAAAGGAAGGPVLEPGEQELITGQCGCTGGGAGLALTGLLVMLTRRRREAR